MASRGSSRSTKVSQASHTFDRCDVLGVVAPGQMFPSYNNLLVVVNELNAFL